MHTRETFFRGKEIRREGRTLPATIYNLTKILLGRCDRKALFVPIRSMLFIAVVDHQEIIFLDGAVSRSNIELAWQNFRPQVRTSLDDPILYEVAYYTPASLETMRRLQGEFQGALNQLKAKVSLPSSAEVIPWRTR